MAESFFAALKNERVHRTQYPTRVHARRDVVRQYCLVKLLRVLLSTFPQRHARDFVDNIPIRPLCFHFPCCSDIFSPWAKPGLVLQWYQVRV